MSEFKDKSGRVVKPGDLVVYGVAYGRCAGLSYGKVLEVRDNPSYDRNSEYNRAGKAKLRVSGVDKPWGSVQVKKPGFLEFSERVLVITPEQVPQDILVKLDKIEVPVVSSDP
jgi:hypothetical protein